MKNKIALCVFLVNAILLAYTSYKHSFFYWTPINTAFVGVLMANRFITMPKQPGEPEWLQDGLPPITFGLLTSGMLAFLVLTWIGCRGLNHFPMSKSDVIYDFTNLGTYTVSVLVAGKTLVVLRTRYKKFDSMFSE